MRDNPIQFAVVREDPSLEQIALERALRRHSKPSRPRALLIASGGCTAFFLAHRFPGIDLTLVDPNPAQLELVRRKLAMLEAGDVSARRRAFNVGDDDPAGLNQCGNFESLFRQLRAFLVEFVAPAEEIEAFFAGGDAALPRRWFASPYWPVAFELHFAAPLLEAMFTAAATRHAEPDSYPGYFRRAFERGLAQPDAATNPFLQHVLLGRYLAMPEQLERRPDARITLALRRIEDVADFSGFDLVSLSNVMDWMDDAAIATLARALCATLEPGAALLWRQLNNPVAHERRFEPAVRFDLALSERMLDAERSLFYSRVRVGFAGG